MRKVTDEEAIKNTKVAIREWSKETVHFRRKLQDEEEALLDAGYVYITNETTLQNEPHKLFDSLEVVLVSDDVDGDHDDDRDNISRQVPWSLLASNEDFLIIKLAFEDPNSMN